MSEYWDTVRAIAEEVREEYPHPDRHHNQRSEYIFESVDGSSYIIYYNENEEVLNETHNEPDNDEVASMSRSGGNWKDMRQTAAFLAMERDVWEALKELDEEAEDEEEEGEED